MTPVHKPAARRLVVICVPPEAQSLDISGPLDCFLEANRQCLDGPAYDVRLVAVDGGTQVRAGGMTLVPDTGFSRLGGVIDTLLIAGTPDYDRAAEFSAFTLWLQTQACDVRRLGSVCTGAFFLGAAGILSGHQVTTHWQHAAELARIYPQAQILPDAIYVADRGMYTSAGVTAGIDLALHLIEEDLGNDMAMAVARRLVVFLRRPGGQSQFSAHLAAQTARESRIASVQGWILNNIDKDLSLAVLADRAGMSSRNFARLFQAETGTTPAVFVEYARIDVARRLLEESDAPLKRIAEHCGYASADTLRRAFQRQVKTSPAEYRDHFCRQQPTAKLSLQQRL
ncbi:GlxA family transcriptional regulator [Roseovarius pacificus]|uniref:GlxA family transcriptional regulator n=1 Tax=Roseovarius pacificus TaxID=337701 RepID=UPI002A18883F|nr:GlxA family transcriptional regulator [Roseovarius pacificus]